jgi:hypothetical protein
LNAKVLEKGIDIGNFVVAIGKDDVVGGGDTTIPYKLKGIVVVLRTGGRTGDVKPRVINGYTFNGNLVVFKGDGALWKVKFVRVVESVWHNI